MCDCIDRLNAELASRNAKLTVGFIMNPAMHSVVTLSVKRLDLRGQKAIPPRVYYCPFCGEPYPSRDLDKVGYAPGLGEESREETQS